MTNKIHILGATVTIKTLAILANLAILISLKGMAQTPLFLPAVSYDSSGRAAASVAIADVNHDSNLDLVVANYGSYNTGVLLGNNIGVLLGNGDGTFRAAIGYAIGGQDDNPISLAVADLNGDGNPDVALVAVVNGQPHPPIRVLLGNGDGSFRAPLYCDAAASNPYQVLIADVNADGKPDLIVADEFLVSVLLGNGDGTFQAATTYGTGGAFGHSAAVADVNGDASPDVVVGNSGPVGVLLGKGDGTFLPAATYPTGGPTFWVALADVNADGKPDVLVSNYLSVMMGSMSVLLGNGNGSFQAPVIYSSGGEGAWGIAVADVNSDAKLDALIANASSGTVGVLLGKGDGAFQSPQMYASGGSVPLSIAVADLNGDGRPDLVVANGGGGTGTNDGVGVLLNPPVCTNPPAIMLSATPKMLWPANGKTVPVSISGTITETDSGCLIRSTAYAVKDEYGQVQPGGPVTLAAGGAYNFTVWLQASRLGADLNGRLYTITVTASNNAGKAGSKMVNLIVPHDQGH